MSNNWAKAFLWALGIEAFTLVFATAAKHPLVPLLLQLPGIMVAGMVATGEDVLALAALIQLCFWTLVAWVILAKQDRRRKLGMRPSRGGWVGLVVFAIFIVTVANWPQEFFDRRRQRAEVQRRLESFGGLEGLRAECLTVISNQVPLFFLNRGENTLPPVLAALRPQRVDYHPEWLSMVSPGMNAQVVKIKIFGTHSTGGYSTPYYGLEFVHGPDAAKYAPEQSAAVSGNGHRHHRLIGDGLYEVY